MEIGPHDAPALRLLACTDEPATHAPDFATTAGSGGVPMWLLPLVDSITFGCGSDSDAQPSGSAVCAVDAAGYRVPLLETLSAAMGNWSIVSVGTLTNAPASVLVN